MRVDRGHRRSWRDAGAAAAEYALIFAVFVAGSVGAFEYLTRATTAEVNNQADCVSTRPPPPSCNYRESRPTTTTTAPPSTTVPPTVTVTSSTTSTTTTTLPPTTTTTIPPTNGAWVSSGTVRVNASLWYARAEIQLTSGGNPVAGARVVGAVRILNPPTGQVFLVECTTAANGRCELRYDVPYTDVTRIELSVQSVESVPPAGTLPLPLEFPRP